MNKYAFLENVPGLTVDGYMDSFDDGEWISCVAGFDGMDRVMECAKQMIADGYSLINGASGTCVFTSSVTDMSAYSRKRIILLNESQSLCILALCCQFQISLNGDMCRTCCLTGSGT